MVIITRIGVWSVTKIYAVLMAIGGFLFGLLLAAFSTLADSLSPTAAPTFIGAGFGMAAIVIMPIVYGLMGLIIGAVTGWLYNLVASWVGGIELELHESIPPHPVAS